jgi:HK97 family phage portal protein
MFQTFLSWFAGLDRRPGTQTGGPAQYSSVSPSPVTFDTALQLSAVWACSRLLAETIAALPVSVIRTTADGSEVDTTSDLAVLFAGKMNRYQTRMEFFETFILNLVMHGNAYALKQYSGSRLVGLLPINSSQVEVKLLNDGSLAYCYSTELGVQVISEDNIWHVKLFGNGVIGLSPLAYARNTFGIAQAGEAQVANVFRNGGKPSGILTIDSVLKPEQREQVRREFKDLREGNTDRLMVLEAGMKYSQVSMTPGDIQLLESRRFQIEDIARFFGVPSVLINDTSGSTVWGSGISEIVQGFYKLNLRPYLERLEASALNHLIPAAERSRTEIRFDFDALLRANKQERITANSAAINSAQLTPNEARKTEGQPPVEGGDQLLINSTLVPVGLAGVAVQGAKPNEEEAIKPS